jgi:pyruvoyl-dependent arginine decarboxylase (PvlArgDC)
MEDYDAAIADLKTAAERNPTALFLRWRLAAAYAQAGKQEDAEWQVEEMMGMGFQSRVKELLETSVIHHPHYVERFAVACDRRAFRNDGIKSLNPCRAKPNVRL